MAALLHHCPFLKSSHKPALRRTGAALLSLAYRCPIVARQITICASSSTETKTGISSSQSAGHLPLGLDSKRHLAKSATQVSVSISNGCPFVSSQMGMVKASAEVQEDVESNTGTEKDGKLQRLTRCVNDV